MWSKGYHVTDAELRELHGAMDRHDGLFYLAAAAGFVADHKAKAIGSISATSIRLTAISSRSWWVEATRIHLNTGRSTSRGNGYASSASGSSSCPVVTSQRMSSRKPLRL